MNQPQTSLVANLDQHIGQQIEFQFSFGIDDTQTLTGYLHATSPHPDGYSTYLHISNQPTLPKDQDPKTTGGYAVPDYEIITILT